MLRSSSNLTAYLRRSLTSLAVFRPNFPACFAGGGFSGDSLPSSSMPPSFLTQTAFSSWVLPAGAIFRNDTLLSSHKGMRLKGYALFSTASGNVNESKQLIKQKTSQDIKGDRAADMKILTTLAKYLWLKDNLEFRLRVVAALGFLVGAKVPFLFKLAVDWLATATGNADALASFNASNSYMLALFVSPAAVLLGYGIARSCASAFNAYSLKVSVIAAAKFQKDNVHMVFAHLHELDLRYHLSRETGALNRIIDRGSRAINFILSSMVFNIVPTILEVFCDSSAQLEVLGLQWRTKFRKAMNKADNDASTRAIDSLINYEARCIMVVGVGLFYQCFKEVGAFGS
ncbi:hypothetical protein Cgig2_016721 [Carnegiea gigantea]|uniref:ABC transmembrane type-1 domain-containing protein n=1 Tax=Carnegiea gigantea TaxID=171969 RepID=A0A9Q1KZY5_9CARY|nr:hypothetical protein Cgig2_016721 [Carnegiea gigantea]